MAVAPVARELEGGADRGGDLRAGGDRADVAGPARAALGRTCARIQAHKPRQKGPMGAVRPEF